MAHEIIARIVFENEAQAVDLMAQIQARMTNATVAGVGTPSLRTSYARHEADGTLVSMVHADEWGITRSGEYEKPDPYPAWIQPSGAHDSYPMTRLDGQPTRVTHNGQNWESTHDGANSWEPGVFGWVQV